MPNEKQIGDRSGHQPEVEVEKILKSIPAGKAQETVRLASLIASTADKPGETEEN